LSEKILLDVWLIFITYFPLHKSNFSTKTQPYTTLDATSINDSRNCITSKIIDILNPKYTKNNRPLYYNNNILVHDVLILCDCRKLKITVPAPVSRPYVPTLYWFIFHRTFFIIIII